MPNKRAAQPEEDLVRLYLNDIGKYALLTKDDEARLAQAAEATPTISAKAGTSRVTTAPFPEPPPDRPLSSHFCLSTAKFDETLEWLREKGVGFVNLAGEVGKYSFRADGVRQTYCRDPDNYWVEICESDENGKVG